mmetsp:Transcript_38827/g.112242  ORF Transcript_38827/g.112242 Transcript_38827/m.112242 type:complete len:490 (+) Transcript_38827:577-2046(+)
MQQGRVGENERHPRQVQQVPVALRALRRAIAHEGLVVGADAVLHPRIVCKGRLLRHTRLRPTLARRPASHEVVALQLLALRADPRQKAPLRVFGCGEKHLEVFLGLPNRVGLDALGGADGIVNQMTVGEEALAVHGHESVGPLFGARLALVAVVLCVSENLEQLRQCGKQLPHLLKIGIGREPTAARSDEEVDFRQHVVRDLAESDRLPVPDQVAVLVAAKDRLFEDGLPAYRLRGAVHLGGLRLRLSAGGAPRRVVARLLVAGRGRRGWRYAAPRRDWRVEVGEVRKFFRVRDDAEPVEVAFQHPPVAEVDEADEHVGLFLNVEHLAKQARMQVVVVFRVVVFVRYGLHHLHDHARFQEDVLQMLSQFRLDRAILLLLLAQEGLAAGLLHGLFMLLAGPLLVLAGQLQALLLADQVALEQLLHARHVHRAPLGAGPAVLQLLFGLVHLEHFHLGRLDFPLLVKFLVPRRPRRRFALDRRRGPGAHGRH